MSSLGNRDLIEAIRTIAGVDEIQYDSVLCTVSDIDLTANTCTCTPMDGSAPLFGIILSVNLSKGFLLIPTDGSRVEVTLTSNTTGFISMVSDASQAYILGDANGGIVKVVPLVTKINNLENDINTLKTAFSAWVVVPNDGGAALKTITSTWAGSALTPTVRADIENTKIKNGNG